MFELVLTLHIAIAIILIFIVLLQSGKGSEMGAAFGGIGQASSARGEMSGLAKFTNSIAAVFMVTSLVLAYLSSQEVGSSVVSKIQEGESTPVHSTLENQAEETPAPTLDQTDAPDIQNPQDSNQ